MSKRKTFYYHIGPLEPDDIVIRVALRQVRPPNDESTNNIIGVKRVEALLAWQQKIDGPLDIANGISRRSIDEADESIHCDPTRRISELGKGEYLGILPIGSSNTRKQLANFSFNAGTLLEMKDFDNSMNIYTHVDRDYYISNDDPSVSTSLRDSKPTHISNAMKGLPAHNLHSNETLPVSAAALHDRISRDDPCKMMYIMAAVDCDVEQ